MHNLRCSLATCLTAIGCHLKTVQAIPRHANPFAALPLYAHGRSQERWEAQGDRQAAFFKSSTKPSTDMVR
jgi:hypothetical protein